MKFKYTITAYALLLAMVFSSCGEGDKNIAQIGLWYATNVSRTGCTNEALNGSAFCSSDGTSYSCVELNLRETSYTLDVNLDSNITNEVGTYKISDGNIQLCPTAPLGSCYDVPVANASSQNMTISLKRNTGCTAVVELIKI